MTQPETGMNMHGEWQPQLTTLKISLTKMDHKILQNAKIDLNRDQGVGIRNGQSLGRVSQHTETN